MDSSKTNPCPDCGAGQGELHLPECIWVGDQWTPEQLASFKRASVPWTGVSVVDQQLLKQREAGEPLDMLKASVAARISKLAEMPKPQRGLTVRDVRLARTLCELQGHDPDRQVVDVRTTDRSGPFGSVPASCITQAWNLYMPMATEIIDALDRKEVPVDGTENSTGVG